MRATDQQGVRPRGVTRREALQTGAAGLGGLALLGLGAGRNQARADEIPAEYQPCVSKGLDWLAKTQSKDGHWEAFGGQYPLTMTGLSGMAMLMEGSTLREGKYKDHIRRAVDWLMARSHAQRHDRQPEHPRRGRPLHVRPRLSPCFSSPASMEKKKRAIAARSWRTC